jgi:hypothetical protein
MIERSVLRSCLLAIGIATSAACTHVAPTISRRTLSVEQASRMLWPDEVSAAYRPPTEEQRRALGQLIGTLWAGVLPGPADELAELAERAGMVLELWTIASRPTWVVREPATEPHGLGIYLIHAAALPRDRTILLEAPHVYFDMQTQSVAADMFWAADARPEIHGLFTSSTHRFQREGKRKKRRFNPADVAHNAEHPFQTATSAVIARGPVVVIQLHGFDGDRRDATVHAIVSAARPEGSTKESSSVATALAATLGAAVARFPEDTASLGGLDNVQGRLIAATPSAQFVHVELELALRTRLRGTLAARWARALVDALATPATP